MELPFIDERYLRGRHRFAVYELTFVPDGNALGARTHAAFPGLRGWLYASLVLRTGAHRWVTRRLLRQVAAAELDSKPV